jgi:hypothetical protein
MALLLADIAAFLVRYPMPESVFGDEAMGDSHLIRDLRDGRELRWENEKRVRDAMVRLAKPQARAVNG